MNPISIQRVNVKCMQRGLAIEYKILYSNGFLRVFSVNTKRILIILQSLITNTLEIDFEDIIVSKMHSNEAILLFL